MRFRHEGLLSALVLVLAEKLRECGHQRLTVIARGLQSLRYGPAAFVNAHGNIFTPCSMAKLDLPAVECLLDYLSTISHPVRHKASFTSGGLQWIRSTYNDWCCRRLQINCT
ncbi:unnamed protein product [Vitrella brassicaformis CCMP3155]|uniref:Uncharacterized protein n=1 Tax=Vitrella brassicaformis (strain CCMP3155) TaxID=1169540 RepID=A0A0G4F427_VITBC|nr:unnamed protein product [Vitrella brassicaformis CCMP3155]|eukprot:CEM06770.1 unnamed protein product [Vitrella brassicaformis CCMP3155]